MVKSGHNRTVTLHSLQYSKADLDAIPDDDRYFFLMATGLANDTQMLNKALAVILDSDEPDCPRIVNQANSAFAMMILRMLAGRLNEGWKLLSSFSKVLKVDYEPNMKDDAQVALKELRRYFNPKGKRSYILDVRDHVAFHSLRKTVEAAYATLPDTDDLGDYLHSQIGNTLYYTTEILHYEVLKNLAGVQDHATALRMLLEDTMKQTSNFNTTIYGFAVVFCERFLPVSLQKLENETETIAVGPFGDLKLSFFSELPIPPGPSSRPRGSA